MKKGEGIRGNGGEEGETERAGGRYRKNQEGALDPLLSIMVSRSHAATCTGTHTVQGNHREPLRDL